MRCEMCTEHSGNSSNHFCSSSLSVSAGCWESKVFLEHDLGKTTFRTPVYCKLFTSVGFLVRFIILFLLGNESKLTIALCCLRILF
jgi:hypothetical protein